ncbi:MAG: hypothetical protein ACE5EY_05490, partial [Anaerolineae bacterium]
DYAFVAADVGLVVVDISDPTAPQEVNKGGTEWARDVVLADGYAYVNYSLTGLAVLDISDPVAPRRLSGLALEAAKGITQRWPNQRCWKCHKRG